MNLDDPEVKAALEKRIEEETEGLKAKNAELFRELVPLKELRDKLRGVDPDEIQTLLEREKTRQQEEEERTRQEIEQKKDWEGRERQYQQTLEKKDKALAEAEDRVRRVEQLLHRQVAESRLKDTIAQEGGVPEILLPHLRERVRVEMTDEGDFDIQVLNGGNKPMLTAKGEPASLKDLVAEYKGNELFQPVFKSNVKPGSGATASTTRAEIHEMNNPWKQETLNYTEQRLVEKRDPDRAATLKAQAGIS